MPSNGKEQARREAGAAAAHRGKKGESQGSSSVPLTGWLAHGRQQRQQASTEKRAVAPEWRALFPSSIPSCSEPLSRKAWNLGAALGAFTSGVSTPTHPVTPHSPPSCSYHPVRSERPGPAGAGNAPDITVTWGAAPDPSPNSRLPMCLSPHFLLLRGLVGPRPRAGCLHPAERD